MKLDRRSTGRPPAKFRIISTSFDMDIQKIIKCCQKYMKVVEYWHDTIKNYRYDGDVLGRRVDMFGGAGKMDLRFSSANFWRGAIYRFWELGESKCGAVFTHTIVIQRRRAWRGFRWASGPLWRGVGLQYTRGLYGSPVNRWSIKRTPNGRKLDRRSTGGEPRPLGKSRSIPRTFNTRSQ